MNSTTITYTPRPDATPETELSVLAQVYRFILETKKAAEPTPGPYAAARVKHEEEVSHVRQQIQ